MMTNCDTEGRIFLSHPHTINIFFLLLSFKYHNFYVKKAQEVPEYAEVRHDMTT